MNLKKEVLDYGCQNPQCTYATTDKNITKLHSYDSHGILQLPIQGGNPVYLQRIVT